MAKVEVEVAKIAKLSLTAAGWVHLALDEITSVRQIASYQQRADLWQRSKPTRRDTVLLRTIPDSVFVDGDDFIAASEDGRAEATVSNGKDAGLPVRGGRCIPQISASV